MIIHGDCKYILPTLPSNSINLILTDPPYGVNYQNNATQDIKKHKIDSHGFSYSFLAEQSYRLLTNNTAFFAFTHWSQYPKHFEEVSESELVVKEPLICQKNSTIIGDTNGTFSSNAEWLLFATKGQFTFEETCLIKNKHYGKKRYDQAYRKYKQRLSSCWFGEDYPIVNEHPQGTVARKYSHPTIKNLEFIEWLILLCTKENDTVLDPYAGTCTVGLACKNLRRNYICIEKEEEYVKMGEDRINGVGYEEDWSSIMMRM